MQGIATLEPRHAHAEQLGRLVRQMCRYTARSKACACWEIRWTTCLNIVTLIPCMLELNSKLWFHSRFNGKPSYGTYHCLKQLLLFISTTPTFAPSGGDRSKHPRKLRNQNKTQKGPVTCERLTQEPYIKTTIGYSGSLACRTGFSRGETIASPHTSSTQQQPTINNNKLDITTVDGLAIGRQCKWSRAISGSQSDLAVKYL